MKVEWRCKALSRDEGMSGDGNFCGGCKGCHVVEVASDGSLCLVR